MLVTETNFAEIEKRMQALQCQCGPWHTNYFRQPLTGSRYWMCATERSLVFWTDDIDFFRLYFFTVDLMELTRLVREFPLPCVTVTAYLTRQVEPAIDSALQDAGFKPYAVFRRMSNRSLRVCKTNSRIEFATQDDVDELLRRLRADFPLYTGHQPSRAMLENYVQQQWVLVNRQGAAIVGYLLFQIIGKQVNYNYVFMTSANLEDFQVLQENFYGLMAQKGIRSGVLWVNEMNTQVIEMNELLGWKFDGLMNRYYVHNYRE